MGERRRHERYEANVTVWRDDHGWHHVYTLPKASAMSEPARWRLARELGDMTDRFRRDWAAQDDPPDYEGLTESLSLGGQHR